MPSATTPAARTGTPAGVSGTRHSASAAPSTPTRRLRGVAAGATAAPGRRRRRPSRGRRCAGRRSGRRPARRPAWRGSTARTPSRRPKEPGPGRLPGVAVDRHRGRLVDQQVRRRQRVVRRGSRGAAPAGGRRACCADPSSSPVAAPDSGEPPAPSTPTSANWLAPVNTSSDITQVCQTSCPRSPRSRRTRCRRRPARRRSRCRRARSGVAPGRRATPGSEEVCRRTCLTVTSPSPQEIELAVGAVGRPARLDQEAAQVVVAGVDPGDRGAEPVGDQRVDAGLHQP